MLDSYLVYPLMIKSRFLLLVFFGFFVSGCSVILGWRHYSVHEPNGRVYLKKMSFKETFKPQMAGLIDENAVYISFFKRNYDEGVQLRYFGVRFFNSGQYIFRSGGGWDVDYDGFNHLKQGFVGYYNFDNKKNTIIIEMPNFLFRRSGYASMDEYKVMYNGDLESITSGSPDRGLIFFKINSNKIKLVQPDW